MVNSLIRILKSKHVGVFQWSFEADAKDSKGPVEEELRCDRFGLARLFWLRRELVVVMLGSWKERRVADTADDANSRHGARLWFGLGSCRRLYEGE